MVFCCVNMKGTDFFSKLGTGTGAGTDEFQDFWCGYGTDTDWF